MYFKKIFRKNIVCFNGEVILKDKLLSPCKRETMTKLSLFFILSLLSLVTQANECRRLVLEETGLQIWKAQHCIQSDLDTFSLKLKQCEKQGPPLALDEEKLALNFVNKLLKIKLDQKELQSLKIPELSSDVNSQSSITNEENLEICLRKVAIVFSFKAKDILLAKMSILAENNSFDQCRKFLKNMKDLYTPSFDEKINFCAQRYDKSPQKTNFAFCKSFGNGCFFIY